MSNAVYSIEQIKSILTPIFKSYKVNRAVLFGSYVKGIATQESDIDLLVDSGLRGLRFVGLMEEVRNAVDKEIDMLDVSHIEKNSRIEDEINRTGVLLYEE